jgi:hypothetical protein
MVRRVAGRAREATPGPGAGSQVALDDLAQEVGGS